VTAAHEAFDAVILGAGAAGLMCALVAGQRGRKVLLLTRFLNDGRVCLSNNAAERALRGIALGRKSWLLAGR
jgi:flavin-dependent dehydrogenase